MSEQKGTSYKYAIVTLTVGVTFIAALQGIYPLVILALDLPVSAETPASHFSCKNAVAERVFGGDLFAFLISASSAFWSNNEAASASRPVLLEPLTCHPAIRSC